MTFPSSSEAACMRMPHRCRVPSPASCHWAVGGQRSRAPSTPRQCATHPEGLTCAGGRLRAGGLRGVVGIGDTGAGGARVSKVTLARRVGVGYIIGYIQLRHTHAEGVRRSTRVRMMCRPHHPAPVRANTCGGRPVVVQGYPSGQWRGRAGGRAAGRRSHNPQPTQQGS